MTPYSLSPLNWPSPDNERKKVNGPAIDLHGLTLLLVAAACLTGMVVSSLLQISPLSLLIGIVPALIGVPLLWNDTRGRIILLIVFSLLVGVWRYASVSPQNDPNSIYWFVNKGKVEIQGSISNEPTIQGKSRVLPVSASRISLDAGATWQNADGEVEVRTLDTGGTIEDPYGANYGDAVEVQGKLQSPDQYTPAGMVATMAFPRISVTSSGGIPILAALFHLRVLLATAITQSLPQPEASVLIAILLSLRTPAIKPLANYFNETGTAHLIAPSGFKVTLVCGIIISSTRWLDTKRTAQTGKTVQQWQLLPAERRKGAVRRWLVTSLVLLCITIYTILSGLGPAAIRAGIMGVLMVIAPKNSRVYNVYTALAFAALVMCLIDPFVLWDVGFQLSFLGTLGIIRLGPSLQRLLSFLDRVPFGYTISELTAMTLAAEIATLIITAQIFNTISIIAPLTNILTVPLLGIILSMGIVISVLGLFASQLSIICGWAILPLLRYVVFIIWWCAHVPGAYITVPPNAISTPLGWGLYGLLALIIGVTYYRWPYWFQIHDSLRPRGFSKRTWLIAQISILLLFVLATGTSALATPANRQLTITFLRVGPANQPLQGEAILIQTPDGKTVFIDGGPDTVSLDQQLDSQLPSWQRSLDLVLLTTPRSDHLVGSQDIVSRYQIGEVADAGMLHPNTGYALWRHTIAERNIRYLQLRQGMTIPVGTQLAIQVFWPTSPLHKSSDEERDNGLIVRIVTPNLRMLLLGVTANSNYALEGLLAEIAPAYLQTDIVQVVGQTDKPFSSSLLSVLQLAHTKLLIISPASLSAKQRKAGASTIVDVSPELNALVGQVVQTAQMGTLQIHANSSGWNVTPV